MRVVKVLNNSLVLALDENGAETILMGKGIGFHKAAGYEFKLDEVEKVFVLRDRQITRNIIRLAAEIDSVYFEITKKIIDYAIEEYQMELLDFVYLALTDHIAFAVKRHKDGIFVPNFYVAELQRFNPNEYAVGEYGLNILKERLDINMPVDEAGHIAFQLINAQKNIPNRENNRKVYEMTEQIMSIIKYHYQIVYDEESNDYGRLITYIRRTVQRLVMDQGYPEDPSGTLMELIATNCAEITECVKKIALFLRETYQIVLSNQEQVFMALSIRQYLIARLGDKFC